MTINTASNLAVFYSEQGRLNEASTLLRQTLERAEGAFGSANPILAPPLNNLGGVLVELGAYPEAQEDFERALTICENMSGGDHLCVGENLNDLAIMFGRQGRSRDAEAFLKRALSVARSVAGDDARDTAMTSNNLAAFYFQEERYIEAERLYLDSLRIFEKTKGASHPDTASPLGNLANLYQTQGRFEEATPYFERTIAIREEALGEGHPTLAVTLNNYAAMLQRQGELTAAEQLYQRVLATREQTLGSEHPLTTETRTSLAGVLLSRSRLSEARSLLARAVRDMGLRLSQGHGGRFARHEMYNLQFRAGLLVETTTFLTEPTTAADTEAFVALQWATRDDVGATVDKALTSFADGTGELARLLRERQGIEQRLAMVEQKLVRIASNRAVNDDAGMTVAQERTQQLRAEFDKVTQAIVIRFPAFADLVGGLPIELAAAQQSLGPNEALLLVGLFEQPELADRETPAFAFLVTPNNASLRSLDQTVPELSAKVSHLRQQLDPGHGGGIGSHFDVQAAHALYEDLFGEFGGMLDGTQHLYVVADGALESLPFNLLITELPNSGADLSGMSWLIREMAVTTLASAASLNAMRAFTGPARGGKPFLGVGDPVLHGSPGVVRGASSKLLFTADGLGDVRAIRAQLMPLPETADELRSVASSLQADADALLLGAAANERTLREMDLSDRRVIAFATHGLLAEQISAVAEPALVLSPPTTASSLDDGLLVASEIAAMALDADLVLLSACNTAAANGTPGAPGLSGLAKAFMQAGARALLVSHWEVYSTAAQRLTTGMVNAHLADPVIGHAEALRRSMLEMIDDPSTPEFANPAVWAPFVIVGDGNAKLIH